MRDTLNIKTPEEQLDKTSLWRLKKDFQTNDLSFSIATISRALSSYDRIVRDYKKSSSSTYTYNHLSSLEFMYPLLMDFYYQTLFDNLGIDMSKQNENILSEIFKNPLTEKRLYKYYPKVSELYIKEIDDNMNPIETNSYYIETNLMEDIRKMSYYVQNVNEVENWNMKSNLSIIFNTWMTVSSSNDYKVPDINFDKSMVINKVKFL